MTHPLISRCTCTRLVIEGHTCGCVCEPRLTLAQIDQALSDARGRAAGMIGPFADELQQHIDALLSLREDMTGC